MEKEKKQTIVRHILTTIFIIVGVAALALAVLFSKFKEYYDVTSVGIPINYLILNFFAFGIMSAIVVFLITIIHDN